MHSPKASEDLLHLAKFHVYIKGAIAELSFMEVLVASYLVLFYSIRTREPFQTAFVYFKGICSAYSELLLQRGSASISTYDVDIFWLSSLVVLYFNYLHRDLCTWRDFDQFRQLQTILQPFTLQLIEHLTPLPSQTAYSIHATMWKDWTSFFIFIWIIICM
jgi:hypothetical protein